MSAPDRDKLLAILDLARWAPSGDNTQPWRFEILTDDHVVVHGFDTRDNCVYDLDGYGSRLGLGALLETMRIAATRFGFDARVSRRVEAPETKPTFDVRFVDSELPPSGLIDAIEKRSVQRRPMRTRTVTPEHKAALQASIGTDYELGWLDGFDGRVRGASLLARAARLRLNLPEAFPVHKGVIEPGARFSIDRIPDGAVGLDPLTFKVVHWAMRDWERMSFFNKYMGGVIFPSIQLDFVPGMFSAGLVYLRARTAPQTLDDEIAAGAAVQRFWLALTQLGLVHQPAVTPLIFGRYLRQGRSFSAEAWATGAAEALMQALRGIVGVDNDRVVWMGRIGYGKPAKSRSLRLPLERLLVTSKNLTAPR
jgi:sulfur-carrier protein adenylyltransferase/sulfurtransferase